MREPYTQLYLHLVWATWDRLPLLSPELTPSVYACIQAGCTRLRAEVIAIGGVSDHAHLLTRIPATLSVAALVKQIKGASSHLATHRLLGGHTFKWQGAYGAFTVSKSDVPRIHAYIQRQEEHHRDQTLSPEFELP
jgi:putative transposase